MARDELQDCQHRHGTGQLLSERRFLRSMCSSSPGQGGYGRAAATCFMVIASVKPRCSDDRSVSGNWQPFERHCHIARQADGQRRRAVLATSELVASLADFLSASFD